MLLVSLLSLSLAQASAPPLLADLQLLEKAGAKILEKNTALGLGLAESSPLLEARLSRLAHEAGKCGGYELLPGSPDRASSVFEPLLRQWRKNSAWELSRQTVELKKRPEVAAALAELSETKLRETTEWLASYPSRSNRLPNPNVHVNDLEAKVREIMGAYPGFWSVEQIAHSRTRQKTLKVRLEGKSRPGEIVVLGGHLDSISHSWSEGGQAPGADDNASGSANLLEALRVLAGKTRPERSVEFFWYAGEESGLLGSSEIAQKYSFFRVFYG